jgi:hypothetical protein
VIILETAYKLGIHGKELNIECVIGEGLNAINAN